MKRRDKRVERTCRALAKALVSLTLEKGYEEVSIREVTERAEVGYATFFRHFKSKDELLHEVLQVLLDEVMALLPQGLGLDFAQQRGEILFRYVEEHADLLRMLLGRRASGAFYHDVRALGVQLAVEEFSRSYTSQWPMDVVAHHVVSSVLALVEWWLENEQPHSVAAMGEMYDALLIEPLRKVLLLREAKGS